MTYPATKTQLCAQAMPGAWCGIIAFVAITLCLGAAASRTRAEEAATKVVKPAAAGIQGETTTPSPHAPMPAGRQTGRIQYVGPDTFILLDSDGRPQPVPGMSYEDFLAAWKKMNQVASPESRPRFTIESIKIEGKAHNQTADLKLEAVVHILADGPVDVPLGLVGAILQGEPRFGKPAPTDQNSASDRQPAKGKPEDEYLDYDPQHGGFVARLTGHVGERQSLSFELLVPLSRDGPETTLSLNCPRSVSSSLALNIDSAIVDVRTGTGAVITKSSKVAGGTRVEVAGPTGQFRLSWQNAKNDAASIASVLNAVGAIRVAIDGRGVRSNARLTVSSFGGTFDHFRVRLPRGAKLIPGGTSAASQDRIYRISEESQTPGSTTAANNVGQIVLVELKEKQQGSVVVDLSTEQASSPASAGQPLELGGFEVLDAVRQFGDIALNVANDWQAAGIPDATCGRLTPRSSTALCSGPK